MKDFEVLPIGTTRELMFARKFAKDMIELSQKQILPPDALELVRNVEQAYKELRDDDLDR